MQVDNYTINDGKSIVDRNAEKISKAGNQFFNARKYGLRSIDTMRDYLSKASSLHMLSDIIMDYNYKASLPALSKTYNITYVDGTSVLRTESFLSKRAGAYDFYMIVDKDLNGNALLTSFEYRDSEMLLPPFMGCVNVVDNFLNIPNYNG